MRKINREIVSALIFSKDGKLFQGRKDRTQGGVYLDFWHIPGGGVEDGETNEQALIREIREEMGIDLSYYKFELVDNKGDGESTKILKKTGEKVLCKMRFNVFKVVLDKKAEDVPIVLSDDLIEYSWTDISKLNTLKLTPPSEELFKRLGYIS